MGFVCIDHHFRPMRHPIQIISRSRTLWLNWQIFGNWWAWLVLKLTVSFCDSVNCHSWWLRVNFKIIKYFILSIHVYTLHSGSLIHWSTLCSWLASRSGCFIVEESWSCIRSLWTQNLIFHPTNINLPQIFRQDQIINNLLLLMQIFESPLITRITSNFLYFCLDYWDEF